MLIFEVSKTFTQTLDIFMLQQHHVILERQRVVCCQKVVETAQKKIWNQVPEFFWFQIFLNQHHDLLSVLYCFKRPKGGLGR